MTTETRRPEISFKQSDMQRGRYTVMLDGEAHGHVIRKGRTWEAYVRPTEAEQSQLALPFGRSISLGAFDTRLEAAQEIRLIVTTR